MKRRKLLNPLALAAVGVFLGRGAQAQTTLTFDALPAGQSQNAQIIQTFGDNASASSPGVSVMGQGTPNIGLTWQSTGGRWDYYIDSVWSAGQLDSSGAGDLHELVFTPDATWGVTINSFNFHPYYVSQERYTYNWSVLSGATPRAGGNTSFVSDATKNHPITINFTGNLGEELTLRLERVASALGAGETEGGTQNIAIDDILFAQVPEPSSSTLLLIGGALGLGLHLSRRRHRQPR